MTDFEWAKRRYQSITIPEQLSGRVNQAFENTPIRKHIAWYKPALSVAASICILFVALLNVSQTFAQAMEEIPILGNVAKVLTFRQYAIETEIEDIKVNQPSIAASA